MNRRHFIRRTSGTAGLILSVPFLSNVYPTEKSLTIRQVINKLIAETVGGPVQGSVDTIKTGDASQECSGIVTTFLANIDVIRQTIALGANLLITHEPTFYNHLDETEWLENDEVYQAKRNLLEDAGIVVWRFHDYWHRLAPDGVREGVVKQLDWEQYWVDKDDIVVQIPTISLRELSLQLSKKFGSKRLSYIGNATLEASNIALLPGSVGRDRQIEALQRVDVDVLVVGEVAEWETSEYVRDAASLGKKKGLIIVGHQPSEEPGMSNAAVWIRDLLPQIKVTHISSKDGFISISK